MEYKITLLLLIAGQEYDIIYVPIFIKFGTLEHNFSITSRREDCL